jgi:hypothetical protein
VKRIEVCAAAGVARDNTAAMPAAILISGEFNRFLMDYFLGGA